MKYVFVTGISGAGKSTVLNTLEDMGYHCVDNFPASLIPQFSNTVEKNSDNIQKVAIGVDARSAFDLTAFSRAIATVKEAGNSVSLLFVDCSDAVVLNRYKETRRRHPLVSSMHISLSEAIAEDRLLMSDIKEMADTVIDTSSISSAQLKKRVLAYTDTEDGALYATVMSFGFKYGIPTDADLVFDVRCFPNPFYVESMKHHTGMEDEVYNFVFSFDEVVVFLDKLYDMLKDLIPLYLKEGKTHLNVAIGCTGGKHRSVSITRALTEKLRGLGVNCVEIHRDINK